MERNQRNQWHLVFVEVMSTCCSTSLHLRAYHQQKMRWQSLTAYYLRKKVGTIHRFLSASVHFQPPFSLPLVLFLSPFQRSLLPPFPALLVLFPPSVHFITSTPFFLVLFPPSLFLPFSPCFHPPSNLFSHCPKAEDINLADSSGFITIDCFLVRNFHLPITFQKTHCNTWKPWLL